MVIVTFGAGLDNQPARPLRYSPNSPATSTPAGPPPAMTMFLAAGRAFRKSAQLCLR